MTKSVMIIASNNQFCRNAESVVCSVPGQQAKELKEFAGRTISNSGDSIQILSQLNLLRIWTFPVSRLYI